MAFKRMVGKRPRLVRKARRLSGKHVSLGRQDWVAAARSQLIGGGIDRVKVDVVARALNITRGSFYWHFANREALLDALLQDWRRHNTAPFAAALERADHNGLKEFQAIVDMWLDEKEYNPAYDSAIRDWARTSRRVARLVRQVDRERIRLLAEIFRDLGYEDNEADIRARVTYFHQVGYYALGLQEPKELRRKLAPIYRRVLLGPEIHD